MWIHVLSRTFYIPLWYFKKSCVPKHLILWSVGMWGFVIVRAPSPTQQLCQPRVNIKYYSLSTQEKFEKLKVPEKRRSGNSSFWQCLRHRSVLLAFKDKDKGPEKREWQLYLLAMLKKHPSSSSLVCSFRYSGCPFLFCIQATLSYLVNWSTIIKI